MSTRDATEDYWNACQRLYREGSDVVSSVFGLESQGRWVELIAIWREAAIRFPLLATEMSELPTTDVDPAVVAFARKTCQCLKRAGEFCDQAALYCAYKKDYSESFPANDGLIASAIRLVGLGMNPQQRAAKERLDQMENKAGEARLELGVERSVLNGERDYLYKMLSEKYGMEFERD